MTRKKNQRDPLPERFKTIEEFVEFWDTHDTEDYPEAWREAPVTIKLKTRKFPRVVLELNVAKRLDKRAREEGVPLNKLVNQLLKETLRRATR